MSFLLDKMDFTSNNIPTDLNECFKELRLIMSNSTDEEWFKNSNEDEAIIATHHGLGEYIRNNWGLWTNKDKLYAYLNKLGLWHADDMSTFILRSFHRLLNNKELDLNKQIEVFIEHWKEHEKKHGPIKK